MFNEERFTAENRSNVAKGNMLTQTAFTIVLLQSDAQWCCVQIPPKGQHEDAMQFLFTCARCAWYTGKPMCGPSMPHRLPPAAAQIASEMATHPVPQRVVMVIGDHLFLNAVPSITGAKDPFIEALVMGKADAILLRAYPDNFQGQAVDAAPTLQPHQELYHQQLNQLWRKTLAMQDHWAACAAGFWYSACTAPSR